MGSAASTSQHSQHSPQEPSLQIERENPPLPPIRLIDFNAFVALGTMPRYPENKDLCVTLDSVDRSDSLIVFISHCWLRGWSGAEGWDGRAHPDNAKGDKYRLCVEGIERVKKQLAPGMSRCYIWLDYGCIDQNGDPAGELKQLDEIVRNSDCIFTPIAEEGSLPDTIYSYYEDYQSTLWNGETYGYVNRAWCRVEMLYAANIPLVSDVIVGSDSGTSRYRSDKFAAGFKHHIANGVRPHIVYDMIPNKPPTILPPLQNSYFDMLNPQTGSLSVESDRAKIKELILALKPYIKQVKVGFEGDMVHGVKHGNGKYIYADGDIYEGEWKDGKKHGNGKYIYANGDIYEGEWKDDKQHGNGKYIYANGAIYEGEWKDDKKHGNGKYIYANGVNQHGAMAVYILNRIVYMLFVFVL
jgi:hypothetical protein